MSLSHEQTTELRRTLDQRRAELAADGDPVDTALAAGELRAVEAARARIEEGHYGECMDCGQDIGFARLKATPSALRCIVCQTRLEKR